MVSPSEIGIAIVAFLVGILGARIAIGLWRYATQIAKRTAKHYNLSNAEAAFMYAAAIVAAILAVMYA